MNYINETQGPTLSYGSEVPEEAKQLLREFSECGYNPLTEPERRDEVMAKSHDITKKLSDLGYMIWIGDNEYSIVPKELSKQLLTREISEGE